jgi:hypothetical protein
MALPANHIHISERESAHYWPDGRYDDARWEDCAFDTAVEWARVTHDSNIPATHVEAEALRAASGLGPSGGATIDRVRAGLQARYGFAGTKAVGFAALWAALKPGTAACVQGSMGAFPLGHRLRRFLPSFAGIHQVTAFRLDATDRVWWCDPLAPAGTYNGEWVSKAELAAYVNGFAGNGHAVAPIMEDAVITIETTMFPEGPRRFSIAAGKTVHGYSPASSTPVKTQTFVSGSSASAKAIAVITQVPNRVPYGTFYLGADGVFTNLYIPISEVTLAPAPVSPAPVDLTPFSQEDIDAAVVAAVTPLNARIAGIKKKVAVAAQDIADD